jgi:glutathione S-transferase
VTYLAERYAQDRASLVPADSSTRAHWLESSFFIMTELDATSLYVMRRHQGLRHIYGDAPAAVASAEAYFLKQLGYVDRVLSSGSRYLLGTEFTTADILLTTCLAWATELRIKIYESCVTYSQRTTDREAYKLACATNNRS